MKSINVEIAGISISTNLVDTVIIGSGCAAFNAADCLYDYGRRDIAIITEGLNMGTSRNTGSDKQTFYKLSLAPDESDSVGEMAQTLYSCGGMHGDTALIEAACSVRSFIKLVNYGVPFPTDRYGAYVGYKTDHDPRKRATSAGPYTSKFMTEQLENRIKQKGIRIVDGMSAVKLLVQDGACYGVLAVDEARAIGNDHGLTLWIANHVIMATGGPAGVYSTSVYPESQTGMTGMAIEAGAECTNMMDWQYGLASTKFRWNVSGTYQQVLPRYFSVDPEGNEREFLLDYFDDPMEAISLVFMKGYQWPFDVRKISGSSVIDIIIHQETVEKGNRVFMDFRREPTGLEESGFEKLSLEAYDYLKRSNALMSLPIERLAHMNSAAIQLYKNNGIDLYTEPLEVCVCAQHNNGGISVDADWQSTIKHLYVVGEAAGTFGAYRPGGTALASTQTGAQRAAEHIAFTTEEREPSADQAKEDMKLQSYLSEIAALLDPSAKASDIVQHRDARQKELTAFAAHMRNAEEMKRLLEQREEQLSTFFHGKTIRPRELSQLLRNRDILLTQGAMLSSMLLTAEKMGSRGSGLLIDPAGVGINDKLENVRYIPAGEGFNGQCVVTAYRDKKWRSELQEVRPMPNPDTWFENVWNDYRKRRGQRR